MGEDDALFSVQLQLAWSTYTTGATQTMAPLLTLMALV